MLCYIADLDVWMIFAFGFLTLFYVVTFFVGQARALV